MFKNLFKKGVVEGLPSLAWPSLGAVPKAVRAETRATALKNYVSNALQLLPGMARAYEDDGRFKVVLVDEEQPLLIKITVAVEPADLKPLIARSEKIAAQASELRRRADELEQPAAITGKLNMEVTPDQLLQMLGGKS